VAYPWHPLHGQRVRVYSRQGRAGRQILYIEVQPGLSREIPAWMCDTAVCAAIKAGSAQIAVAGLIELRAVLDSRPGCTPTDYRSPRQQRGDSMTRRFRNQLVLDLGGGGRRRPPDLAPEELLKALADLLLEALGNQTTQ
jgi:Family of unknown function (DUF5372)